MYLENSPRAMPVREASVLKFQSRARRIRPIVSRTSSTSCGGTFVFAVIVLSFG
jgi:hypothetical protein